MLTTTSIENIVALFHTKTEDMPKISPDGECPSYTTLRNFQDAINRNAMAITSPLDPLGHLGIVVSSAEYTTISPTDDVYSEPKKPSSKPTDPSRTRSSTENTFDVHEAIRVWKDEVEIFNIHNTVKNALRNQILNSVDVKYITDLEDPSTQFLLVSPLQILNHLWTNFGEIDESDLRENEVRMKAAWNPPTPIQDLFKQMKTGQDFAKKGGGNIDDTQLVRLTYGVIEDTGMFHRELTKWREKKRSERTWVNFKTEFTKHAKNLAKTQTAQTANYSAAQVQELLDEQFATLTEDYQNPPNPRETEPVPSANALTATDIRKLIQEALAQNITNKGKPDIKEKAQGKDNEGKPVTYCWTHGVTWNLNHNSKTCRRQAEGHKTNATPKNRMGGSNKNDIKSNDTSNNVTPYSLNTLPSSILPCSKLVVDTGASHHFLQQSDLIHCALPIDEVKPNPQGINVLLPNKATMRSTHTASINIPGLPKHARIAHIFPQLASGSLLSVGQLCDEGCTATFNKNKLYIYHKGKTILQGSRTKNKLWEIDDLPQYSHSLNAVIDAPTISERVEFISRALFSPALSTLAQAINRGYLSSFPTITTKQLRRYPPNPRASNMGHMCAQRANVRSTKPKPALTINAVLPHSPNTAPHIIPPDAAEPQEVTHKTTTEGEIEQALMAPPRIMQTGNTNATTRTILPDISHTSRHYPAAPDDTITEENMNPDGHQRTGFVFADAKQITGQIFTDQTGQFTVPSAAGNKQILCLLDYDTSYIKPILLPSRTKEALLNGYRDGVEFLSQAGHHPKLQRLDNEASKMLKKYMHDQKIDFQLTPTGLHRRNHAERAIRTFKAHFIAGLASVDPDFPLNQWDKLVEQAEITLNLLRPSRINPNLSAYEQIHGRFDFNRNPPCPTWDQGPRPHKT